MSSDNTTDRRQTADQRQIAITETPLQATSPTTGSPALLVTPSLIAGRCKTTGPVLVGATEPRVSAGQGQGTGGGMDGDRMVADPTCRTNLSGFLEHQPRSSCTDGWHYFHQAARPRGGSGREISPGRSGGRFADEFWFLVTKGISFEDRGVRLLLTGRKNRPPRAGLHSHRSSPVKFLSKYVQRRNERSTVELRPDACEKTWKVKMDGQRLTVGWKEFADAHDRQDGNSTVLRHEGDPAPHITGQTKLLCDSI